MLCCLKNYVRTVSVVNSLCFPQDDASPAALTDLCLTYVSQNLECFCVKRPDGSLCFREAVHFPQELADQLLAKMATDGKLMTVKLTLVVSLDTVVLINYLICPLSFKISFWSIDQNDCRNVK